MRTKGFSVRNWKRLLLPLEDAFGYGEREEFRVLAIADGITRDPVSENLPDLKTMNGKIKWFLNYPKPSPASIVANMFCRYFVLSQYYLGRVFSEENIIHGFDFSNLNIHAYNENFFPEPDYLKKDLAGCVAAGAVINGENIFYGFIGDCGFAIFDSKGNIKFRTPNEGPNSKGSIDEDLKKKYGTIFGEPDGRKIIRSLYRNNPKEPLAYGALTGQREAMDYVRTGKIQFGDEDIPVLFTDGLEKVIESPEFGGLVRNRDFHRIRRLCKRNVKTEGSLVYCLR